MATLTTNPAKISFLNLLSVDDNNSNSPTKRVSESPSSSKRSKRHSRHRHRRKHKSNNSDSSSSKRDHRKKSRSRSRSRHQNSHRYIKDDTTSNTSKDAALSPHHDHVPLHHGRYSAHDTLKFKTQICAHWKEGHCSWGDRCHFAHGNCDMENVNNTKHKDGVRSNNNNNKKNKLVDEVLLKEAKMLKAENEYLRLQIQYYKDRISTKQS